MTGLSGGHLIYLSAFGLGPSRWLLADQDPGRGALSRNENSPAVLCKGPRSDSQIFGSFVDERARV